MYSSTKTKTESAAGASIFIIVVVTLIAVFASVSTGPKNAHPSMTVSGLPKALSVGNHYSGELTLRGIAIPMVQTLYSDSLDVVIRGTRISVTPDYAGTGRINFQAFANGELSEYATSAVWAGRILPAP